jgi:S1/P1 Nuclease
VLALASNCLEDCFDSAAASAAALFLENQGTPLKKLIALVALLVFLPAQLPAWGVKGHAIVADIASSRLTPTTRKNLNLILGNNSLASIASWPDYVRADRPEASGWHYVDIPRDAAGFSEERDCYRPQDKGPMGQTDHHNCVVDRIEMFRQVLGDENASERDRLIALMFLVHFVGDIHQPLHAIEDARGGNDITVKVFDSDQCGNYPCNLHGAWDYSLLEHTGYSEEEYVHHLQELINKEHLDQKAGGSPADWANESHREALQVWVSKGASIDESYYQANIRLVDERLALAGLRLAAMLNETLGKVPPK